MGTYRAIGLMSGTSLDGIDVALIETDGAAISAFGPTGYRAYEDAERALLRQALAAAVKLVERTARTGVIAEAERLVTETHAEAVETFFAKNGIASSDITIVGFHGQTVLHRPQMKLTVQIGDGKALAQRLGVPVAYDFRAADVAAGGQGAPVVPIFHRALINTLDRPHPVAVLNIGGVANITYCDREDAPIACDTGPGNALLDDFVRARAGRRFDDGGVMASRGKPDAQFIGRVLSDPFFALKPPKSLDRNAFAYASLALPNFSIADGAATLAALTGAAVARIVPHLPAAPASWIIAGGGARNRAMVKFLAQALAPASVETADSVDWSTDALEAQAFAYLAVHTMLGLPITFPTTTGVAKPMTGGLVVKP
jgi:anhydro-N-acetylmuramic acid kinase